MVGPLLRGIWESSIRRNVKLRRAVPRAGALVTRYFVKYRYTDLVLWSKKMELISIHCKLTPVLYRKDCTLQVTRSEGLGHTKNELPIANFDRKEFID